MPNSQLRVVVQRFWEELCDAACSVLQKRLHWKLKHSHCCFLWTWPLLHVFSVAASITWSNYRAADCSPRS